MKYFPRTFFALLAAVIPVLLASQLDFWSQDTVSGSALEQALFRSMNLPGGPVLARRAPAESIAALAGTSHYALRAVEEERALAFPQAEADWIRANNKQDLADFYHRRLEPQKEIDALLAGGRDFARAAAVAHDAALAESVRDRIYQAWIAHDHTDRQPVLAYLNVFIGGKNVARAHVVQAEIARQFPHDTELLLDTEARVAAIDGGPAAALQVYSTHFTPLWPAEIRKKYFELLKNAHQLSAFESQSHNDPARLFFYAEQQENRAEAAHILRDWEPHSSDLFMLGQLFRRVGDYDSAARVFSKLADKEQSLALLIDLLLDIPEQPLTLGQRDLSLYRNIAAMDPHPGFLNGILSVALNTTFPQSEYQNASQTAVAYFHRAAASRLLDMLRQKFPRSTRLPALDAKLFSAYSAYGQNDALIRLVPGWLQRHKNSPEYLEAALLLATAYANIQKTTLEFALYDRLLADLAARSGHLPLGSTPSVTPYSRVLDRYVSRLTQSRRPEAAIALFKNEIDRNPNDPGLYQRLALYVEQNRLDEQLAETYRTAFARFKTVSWADKLARLYLRRKQFSAYRALTKQLTDTFEGSELAAFVAEATPDQKINPSLYRQINLYAHQRFPHNLTFVRNLLSAYQNKATADAGAYEKLLRENWFYDPALRSDFFEYLSRTGKLQAELAALPSVEIAGRQNNVAAIQMRAEGSAWLAQYEASSAAFVKLAELAPGDQAFNSRAISIERSLNERARAIELAEQSVKAAPRDSEALVRVGEIYADHEAFDKAAPWWRRVTTINPGLADGYLDSATVFWDYFRYDDALRMIAAARKRFGPQALFAYEAGAIYENKNKPDEAVREYIQAALEEPSTGQNALAEDRLLSLAKRPGTAGIVDKLTASLITSGFDSRSLKLRLALLESQGNRGAIHALLEGQLAAIQQLDQIVEFRGDVDRFGFDDITQAALQRTIDLSTDPIEKLQARLDLASFRETHQNVAGAERDFASLLSEHPDLLGIIRANVDFYWRQKKFAQAVSTLEAAASRAKPPFHNELLREAAQRAADSGEYAEARRVLDQLLSADPYNVDLLAQKAATYGRAGDSQGLAQFYANELKGLAAATIPVDEKRNRLSALRRGYIPALIATSQFDQALEQYQQLLNLYPEDEQLLQEATHFAEQHQLGDRLFAYYAKATADSPKNYHWALTTAKIGSILGKYPQALEAYGKAAYVRPDRSDILQAKADLETRLLRFEEALKTNQKLYELSYHDSRYLVEEAALNARLGRTQECVRLLRSAYLQARPQEAAGHVASMRQLAAWQKFKEVDQFYRELRPQLSSGSEWASEAVALEARALTSMHRAEEAIASVEEAWQNIKGLHNGAGGGVYAETVGAAAKLFLTPAEKAAFAGKLSSPGFLRQPFDLYRLANAAGFLDLAATALTQQLSQRANANWSGLRQAQEARLAFDSLGRELELLAKAPSQASSRQQLLQSAAEAYSKEGDYVAESRLADVINPESYARAYVARNANAASQLAELAKVHPKLADAVVQYIVAHQSEAAASEAIQSRGANRSPLWTNSYRALAGLYFLSPETFVSKSFEAALGPDTISQILAHSDVQKENSLSGESWFYYAARYGDYLTYRGLPSQHWLPATLEKAPLASDSYVLTGDTLRAAHQDSAAIELYRDALQLSPDRPEVHDRVAVILALQGQTNEAVQEWRRALDSLTKLIETGPLPSEFWQTTQLVLTHLNESRTMGTLKAEVDKLLAVYISKNGAYNFVSLAEGVITDAPDGAKAIQWLLELAQNRNLDPALRELTESDTLDANQRDAVYRFLIVRATRRANVAAGEAAGASREQANQARISYAEYLLRVNRTRDGWTLLNQMQPEASVPAALLLKAAALSGHLEEQLKEYSSKPEITPSAEQILSVAAEIGKAHPDDALRIREFEYQRELAAGEAAAASYFGLAQVRIEQKRIPEAEALLQEVTINVGAPFENLPEAVRILEQAGLAAQALHYATVWRTAEPWNAESELAVARLRKDSGLLEQIRGTDQLPYDVRGQAATLLGQLNHQMTGVDELALLTHKVLSPDQARQPFYVAARLQAAHSADDRDRVRLLREAIALDPSLRELRLTLARAALNEKQMSFGLASLESFTTTAAPRAEGTIDTANALLQNVREQAAAALKAQSQFDRAVQLYDQVLSAELSGVDRYRIRKLRDAASASAKLAALNEQRQPRISEQVTQAATVKPKLTSLPNEGLRK